jgi:hypothetical protein
MIHQRRLATISVPEKTRQRRFIFNALGGLSPRLNRPASSVTIEVLAEALLRATGPAIVGV